MKKGYTPIDCLRELYENYKGEDVSGAIGVSIRQIQNYLKTDGKPATPSPEVVQKIREAFANHELGLPLNRAKPEDYKDKLINALESQVTDKNERIQYLLSQINSLKEELREVALANQAIGLTSQHLLSELVSQQRKQDLKKVSFEISKANLLNYESAKQRGNLIDEGK
jgi:transcriptional regulator with XRE-family HTH domain